MKLNTQECSKDHLEIHREIQRHEFIWLNDLDVFYKTLKTVKNTWLKELEHPAIWKLKPSAIPSKFDIYFLCTKQLFPFSRCYHYNEKGNYDIQKMLLRDNFLLAILINNIYKMPATKSISFLKFHKYSLLIVLNQ